MNPERVRRAVAMAMKAHRDQVDKAGELYIHHLSRVAERVARVTNYDEDSIIAAWLHDIIEDTDVGMADLRHHFGNKVADAVESVTKRKGELYMDFVRRAMGNSIGTIVKQADIDDHLRDPSHISDSLLTRYQKAKGLFPGAINVNDTDPQG